MADRPCRRCGESLRMPAQGRIPIEDETVPPPRRGRPWLRRSFSVGFGAFGTIIAIMVLSAACAIVGVALGD